MEVIDCYIIFGKQVFEQKLQRIVENNGLTAEDNEERKKSEEGEGEGEYNKYNKYNKYNEYNKYENLNTQILKEIRNSLQPPEYEMARIEGSNRIEQTVAQESYIFSTIIVRNKHTTPWPQNVTLQKTKGSLYIETTVIPKGPLPGCKLEFTLPIMTPRQIGVYHAVLRFKDKGREFGERVKIWLNVQVVGDHHQGEILEDRVERAGCFGAL